MTDWPKPVAEQALHGPAGEFVRLVEPHTEADPIALLIQFLVAFGVAAGRHAHLRIEASRHYPNEFCVLVGASGKGRKGSSWDHVEALLAAAEPRVRLRPAGVRPLKWRGTDRRGSRPIRRERHRRARRQT